MRHRVADRENVNELLTYSETVNRYAEACVIW